MTTVSTRPPLRVCIDARLVNGAAGGVQQVVIGLAHALASAPREDQQYSFLCYDDSSEWLRPFLAPGMQLLSAGPAPRERGRMRALLRRNPLLRAAWQPVAVALDARPSAVARSDGTIERAGIDVMHFTLQTAFLTDVPSVYHPHDLQHVHLPAFFSLRERRWRDRRYRAFCAQAALVAVTSSWVKRDLVEQFGIEESKIAVIPLAPATDAYAPPGPADLEQTARRFGLPPAFLLYPAQTWPHKNHLKLLQALALIREAEGVTIPLVCSGGLTEHHARLREEIRRLRLEDHVRFVGYVEPVELRALYHLCRAVVVPSLFEAASYPVWEAFQAGAPVACSAVTSLPEQAGSGALLFDPHSSESIASAIRRIWLDEPLRLELARHGTENVARFTWERTARTFQAHYHRLGHRTLSREDQEWLNAPVNL